MTREERLEAALRKSYEAALALALALDAAIERCAALDAPPAAPSGWPPSVPGWSQGLRCDYADAPCLQGCGEHGWCRRDPNPPTDYIHGSPFTRYADGFWQAPAAEEPAARVSERGEGRGASTGLPDAEPEEPAPRMFAGDLGAWRPINPEDAGDGA